MLSQKAINSEVKAGRGSPHGGAFLDISHRGEEAILKKLPSMHHQFKELAGVDISKEPMEVGPTAHYVMGVFLLMPNPKKQQFPDYSLVEKQPLDYMVQIALVATLFLI